MKTLFKIVLFTLIGVVLLSLDPASGFAIGSGLIGILGLSDSERTMINRVGQTIMYDAVQQYLDAHNADMQRQIRSFVQGQTTAYQLNYRLPGGGRLDRRGGQAQSAAGKATGTWTVAFPLEDFGRQLAYTDVDVAYMTVQDLQYHIDNVRIQDMNTRRYEMLRAIFNNTARGFQDEVNGTLTIQPLANGDSVVYPPVVGSESEATDSHYIVSGYTAANISDTNNPFATIREELEEHFGTPGGYGNVCAFVNTAQVSKIELMTDFDPVLDSAIRPGANTAVPEGLPDVPGRVIGRVSGVWVVEWRWIPANYIYAQDLDMPAPLMERIDLTETGLAPGLQLVAENDRFPFISAHYRDRFGFGIGNRLNGVMMQFKNSGTYDVPAGY